MIPAAGSQKPTTEEDRITELDYPLQGKRVNEKGQSVVYEDYKLRMLKQKQLRDEAAKREKEIERLFNEP